MQHQATQTAQRHARTLRVSMTDSERCLWRRLRLEQLGVKFRRQHPIGQYIVDFACLSPKLIIEIDGSQHIDQALADQARDAWLRAQGFQVLRFWSNDVLTQTEAVLVAIRHCLLLLQQPAPTPTLPQRGRESNVHLTQRGRESNVHLPQRGRESNVHLPQRGSESSAHLPHPGKEPSKENP